VASPASRICCATQATASSAPHQAVGLADDPVLEIEHRELADVTAQGFEPAAEHARMAGLVGALAREPHPQLPLGLRKIAEAAGRAFEAVDLLVHLPVRELDLVQRVLVGKVDTLAPAILDHIARVAGRTVGEQRRVQRRGRSLIRARILHHVGPRC
jgi:hypothetical protein